MRVLLAVLRSVMFNWFDPAKRFRARVEKECRRLGVSFHAINEERVKADDDYADGYFDEDSLVFACGQPTEAWLSTLVHESCHMDQWSSRCPEWQACKIDESLHLDASLVFECWLRGHVELTPDQLDKYLSAIRNLELNCERRALAKIEEFQLPIDRTVYIKGANAYILYHNYMAQVRRRESRRSVSHESILAEMSDQFDMNYETLTPRLFLLYDDVLKS